MAGPSRRGDNFDLMQRISRSRGCCDVEFLKHFLSMTVRTPIAGRMNTLIALALLLALTAAFARDPGGKYAKADPEMAKWFEQLRTCICSEHNSLCLDHGELFPFVKGGLIERSERVEFEK